MTVSIVIPNFNGKHLLAKLLPFLKTIPAINDIVVVDDGSVDGSAEYIKTNFPKIALVEKLFNDGFATSVNLGVKAAKGEIIVLLNTDIQPHENFIAPLLSYFEDPSVFAVGCMDESIEQGKVVKRGRGVGIFKQGFLVHQRGEVDKTNTLWVNGGSGAFRKSIWEKLGGMDEIYNPFYWEDIDLSYRAQKKGYKVVFEPKSVVTHRHEEGAIKLRYDQKTIKKISYRNQFIFFWKNITDIGLFIEHFYWLGYHLLRVLLGGNKEFLVGFIKACKMLPRIIRERKKQMRLITQSDRQIVEQFNA